MYDIDVPGYQSGCNKLHLFDLDSVDESIIGNGIQFDKQDIHKNLTLFLYPDDSDEAGQLLRIYQQYFMVSNAAQLILKEAEERGVNLYHLHEHVCIQINDTHPTMVIPELIRILTEQKGFNIDTAVDVVKQDLCLYQSYNPGRGAGKMADLLSGESGTASDADHPRTGSKSEKRFPRSESVYH